ncbi:MAG: 50S ribosomal protein L11 methyltransferase [Anaerolineales bacterium]
MYDLTDYADMIADRVRMDAFALALKAVIKPDSVVLDIGTGPGIHALLAAKFGARKVYAIEPNDVVHLAREVASVNGFGDRIDFYQDLSTNVSLPEQADIIISDMRGSLPLYGKHIPTIVDARERHLAKGGSLIPGRDVVWTALVDSRAAYKEMINPWSKPYALSMEPIKRTTLNSWSNGVSDRIRARHLLTEPHIWTTLDYFSIKDPNVSNSGIVQRATRDGKAYGWLVWFDTELIPDIGFSNGPDVEKIAEVYGRGFFPLLEPISITAGDTVNLSLHAELIGDEYEWRWHTCVQSQDDPDVIKADFEQSTTIAKTHENKLIAAHISNEQPGLSSDGEIAVFILEKLDGETSVERIAQQVYQAFPDRFSEPSKALFFVHELTQQFKS